MRSLFLPAAISVLASSFTCQAQNTSLSHAHGPDLYVYGTVKTYEERDSLPGASMAVRIPGTDGNLVVVNTNQRGRYEIELNRDHDYRLFFSAPGRVGKSVLIDPTNIPDSIWGEGFAMNIDITLFKEDPRFDFSILKEDIGRARYDAAQGMIAWDLAYTERMRQQFTEWMDRYNASRSEK